MTSLVHFSFLRKYTLFALTKCSISMLLSSSLGPRAHLLWVDRIRGDGKGPLAKPPEQEVVVGDSWEGWGLWKLWGFQQTHGLSRQCLDPETGGRSASRKGLCSGPS